MLLFSFILLHWALITWAVSWRIIQFVHTKKLISEMLLITKKKAHLYYKWKHTILHLYSMTNIQAIVSSFFVSISQYIFPRAKHGTHLVLFVCSQYCPKSHKSTVITTKSQPNWTPDWQNHSDYTLLSYMCIVHVFTQFFKHMYKWYIFNL